MTEPSPSDVTTPLLETKHYLPKWRSGLVLRPGLVHRLAEGAKRKLTLVSAPAGFGKTTLLSEWLTTIDPNEHGVGWVSLDQSDNDPALFWAYFIAALQTVRADIGQSAFSLLSSPQPPPIESVLTALINEINAVERDLTLVLDDFHTIDSQAIHKAVEFFIEHLPPQMHLVVASRSDPPFPLARLRGRGEVAELRVADLRFTADEAAEFLNDAMHLQLSGSDVATLERRTEGWIAGLQLAALSMQGRDDVAGFIKAFAGDNRYIVDYLVEEVLQRQTEQIRSFLLQTSILDRLNGPLCDAVTGQTDSKATLDSLERANLFVIPLDDQRRWFRYHHLFADVLQAHLLEEQPDQLPTRHRRASDWYAEYGSPRDAIRHALASEDFERAADLIEQAWVAMDENRGAATWLEWVKLLPDQEIRVRPVVSVGYGWALLQVGELEAGMARLGDAEQRLGIGGSGSDRPGSAPTGTVVVDEGALRKLPASIASARAYYAIALGDVPRTVKYAKLTLELLPEDDHVQRGVPAALLGLAYWTSGDLGAAEQAFRDAMNSFQAGGNVLYAITGAFVLGQVQAAQGHLRAAKHTYEGALQLASASAETVLHGTAEIHTGLCELFREVNDLEAATQHLKRSRELGEWAPLPHWDYRWCVAHARILEAQGDLDSALGQLIEAERLFIRGPVPEVRPIAAFKARVWVAQGRLDEAMDWAREQNVSSDDELSYPREFEHTTLAKLLIARSKHGGTEQSAIDVSKLLDRLLQAADQGKRTASAMAILVLQALVHGAQDNFDDALVPLQRALTLAEPEGYVRAFVDEGDAMQALLRHAAARGVGGAYTQRLLSAFDGVEHASIAPQPAAASLAVPLTTRELEVLRLIVAGMRNQEIADQLFISLSTVKRHIANAYGKLGVDHRTEAVSQANALHLL